MKPRPRLFKAHAKSVADALANRGWAVIHEFRAPGDSEPYEIILAWMNAEEPPKIDPEELLKEKQNEN
jgi:hypothetical protein